MRRHHVSRATLAPCALLRSKDCPHQSPVPSESAGVRARAPRIEAAPQQLEQQRSPRQPRRAQLPNTARRLRPAHAHTQEVRMQKTSNMHAKQVKHACAARETCVRNA
eukprot:2931199-Pleurochrysis_carterae.AAC.2